MSNKNTLFVGKVLQHFESLESTNLYALQLLSKSKPIEGTAISTFNQTRGRGQIGSKWESEANKNITISFIFYPTFLPINKQFLLNCITSLAVQELITKYIQKPVNVKWPNDIYINNNKVTGILIQNSLSHKIINSAVIGIGLNVNQTTFSPELPNPTSLAMETGKSFNLNELIADLCFFLEKRYLQLKAGHYSSIKEAYLSVLYLYQQEVYFKRADGTTFKGAIQGITELGKLEVEHNDGLEVFDLKEISILNKL